MCDCLLGREKEHEREKRRWWSWIVDAWMEFTERVCMGCIRSVFLILTRLFGHLGGIY